MEYIKATLKDQEQIHNLVQKTIKTVYPKYYPKEVVDFFCELHSRENIAADIEKGYVGILKNENQIWGTGSYKDNHITRVYVAPEHQKQGYGSYIMQCLENEISQNYKEVYLDASLPACQMYEKRGYRTIKYDQWGVENDVILVYGIMEKALPASNTSICYEGKCHSIPQVMEDGTIELREEWQWLNGDKSKGASILIEQ